jgi:hypothetical protein
MHIDLVYALVRQTEGNELDDAVIGQVPAHRAASLGLYWSRKNGQKLRCGKVDKRFMMVTPLFVPLLESYSALTQSPQQQQ